MAIGGISGVAESRDDLLAITIPEISGIVIANQQRHISFVLNPLEQKLGKFDLCFNV